MKDVEVAIVQYLAKSLKLTVTSGPLDFYADKNKETDPQFDCPKVPSIHLVSPQIGKASGSCRLLLSDRFTKLLHRLLQIQSWWSFWSFRDAVKTNVTSYYGVHMYVEEENRAIRALAGA